MRTILTVHDLAERLSGVFSPSTLCQCARQGRSIAGYPVTNWAVVAAPGEERVIESFAVPEEVFAPDGSIPAAHTDDSDSEEEQQAAPNAYDDLFGTPALSSEGGERDRDVEAEQHTRVRPLPADTKFRVEMEEATLPPIAICTETNGWGETLGHYLLVPSGDGTLVAAADVDGFQGVSHQAPDPSDRQGGSGRSSFLGTLARAAMRALAGGRGPTQVERGPLDPQRGSASQRGGGGDGNAR